MQQLSFINPDHEDAWAGVRQQYAPSPEFINLENGYFGMSSLPVQRAARRYQDEVDQENSFFLRMRFPEQLKQVMQALAAFTGVSSEELLITRNAMESFHILIQGYPFLKGDEVVLARHDYDSVIETLAMLQLRKGLKLVSVDVPLDPSSDEEIVALYQQALTSSTRVLILTHVVHRTGQIMPVAKIAAMARSRGIDVMIDAAHSLAQIDYRLPELGVEFAFFNLHKWVGAPLGVGLLYVARKRVPDIEALYGNTSHGGGDIRRLGHFSAVPPVPILAVKDALEFHYAIGARNKEQRLRYLTRYWLERVRPMAGVRVFTPSDSNRYCALAAFGIDGLSATEVAERLMSEHRIFTVVRGIGHEQCVRVTPHLYTSLNDLEALIAAIHTLASK